MHTLDRYSVAHIFTVDNITPEQWADRNTPNLTPEKNLLLAILQDAIRIHVTMKNRTDTYSITLCQETETWIQDESVHWGSFRHCATHLGIDVAYLRQGLNRQRLGTQKAKIAIIRPYAGRLHTQQTSHGVKK
jgi:hypothetical protein